MENWAPVGHPLTPERLAAIESELKITLPDDYRKFLLGKNGARLPEPLHVMNDGEPEGFAIELFLSVGEPIERVPGENQTIQEVRAAYLGLDYQVPDSLIPIAMAYPDVFLMCVTPEAFGHIYIQHWHEGLSEIGMIASGHYDANGAKKKSVIKYLEKNSKVADSFTELLERLGTPDDDTPPMIKAIVTGDIEAVKELLAQGLDPFAPDAMMGISPHAFVSMQLMQFAAGFKDGLPQGMKPGQVPPEFEGEIERLKKLSVAMPAIQALFEAQRPKGAKPKTVMDEVMEMHGLGGGGDMEAMIRGMMSKGKPGEEKPK